MSALYRVARKLRYVSVLGTTACVAAFTLFGTALAAEPERRSLADGPTEFRPETEIDISGPYHADVGGERFPSTLDFWGPKATLKIAMDGQDKPMIGMFLNNRLKVVSEYLAENFNLTTMVEATYDGRCFYGQYSRIDAALGAKIAPIVLTPVWNDGGGGVPVKMPLPPKIDDIPGNYGLTLTNKDGQAINTNAQFALDGRAITVNAGGRVYRCDYSNKEMYPLYWRGNRMDTFKLIPSENGFTGKFVKEINGQEEEFDVNLVKGAGGGGDDPNWTFVYDVIVNNTPPVWIGKLTLHEDQAKLVIDVNNQKATMTGSLVENVLSGTGDYGKSTVSIRAQMNPNGFAGLFRKTDGGVVRQYPIILKNRPARTAGPAW